MSDWNECFDDVLEGLKIKPVWFRDSENLIGKIYLKELYDQSNIDFDEGVDRLVDLIAYLIDENGYDIIKK